MRLSALDKPSDLRDLGCNQLFSSHEHCNSPLGMDYRMTIGLAEFLSTEKKVVLNEKFVFVVACIGVYVRGRSGPSRFDP